MPSHLPLAARKALLGRLTAFELHQPHALGAARAATELVLQEMLNFADAEVGQEKNNNVPLDEWFRTIAKKVSTIAPNLPDYTQFSEMAEMVNGMHVQAQALSCWTCGGHQICRGSAQDDEIVARSGACISRIARLFAAAEAITRRYYAQAPRHSKAKPVVFRFATDHRPTKPHEIPVAFAVGGTTAIRDTRRRAVSEVELLLAVAKLDWEGYLASFYVLLHECVCHAYAGIADDTDAPRPPLQDHDIFAEGWMDWIVGRILEDLAASTGPAAAVALTLTFRADACRVGQQFHLQRIKPQRDDGAHAYGVAQAVRAASRTYEMLQNIVPATARDTMLALSFDLNLLRRSAAEAARLIRIMDRHLGAPGTSGNDAVEGALHRYADSPDVRRFVQELPGP